MNKRAKILDLIDELKSEGYELVPGWTPEADFWQKRNDHCMRAVIVHIGDVPFIDKFEVDFTYVSR